MILIFSLNVSPKCQHITVLRLANRPPQSRKNRAERWGRRFWVVFFKQEKLTVWSGCRGFAKPCRWFVFPCSKKNEPAGARKKWKIIGASSLHKGIFKQKKKKNDCSHLNFASIIPAHNEERISRVIEEMDFGIDVAQQPANLSL